MAGTSRKKVSGGHLQAKKEPPHFCGGFMFALLIFPGSRPPSIVSVHELNFCVRDGNRWTLMTINTNSMTEEVFPFLYVILLPQRSVISCLAKSFLW